jgi:preprotein translocase subunit SecE
MASTPENHAAGGTFWSELLSAGVYKRNQGRVARQVTFAALALTLAVGVWRLSQLLPLWLANSTASATAPGVDLGVVRFLVPGAILAAGLWFLYRLVNMPRFADFLIAVESEMAKVSWPTGAEVARSSAVVIFLIFALAAILAAYDLFWWFVLRAIQGFN